MTSDPPDAPLQPGDLLFQDGNTTLGDVPVPAQTRPGFQAVLPTTPALAIGTHHLTAVYQGLNFQGPGAPPNVLATSDPVDETITAPSQPAQAPSQAPPSPAPPTPRTTQILLRIPGLGTESLSVDGFTWGLAQGTGVGGAVKHPRFQNFTLAMRAGAQSPDFFIATATGKHFKAAMLTILTDADPSKGYLTFFLKRPHVLVHTINGATGSGLPVEFVQLDSEAIKLTHIGGASGEWDLLKDHQVG